MSKTLPERLRDAARKLRTSSMPLSDYIPLLQQAADALESRAMSKTLPPMPALAAIEAQGVEVKPIEYTPGKWFDATTVDIMQAFFESRMPAIREAAKEHGYAIGLHGSMRRDLDLIAAPWRDGASDPDTLAHAIAMAACGITRDEPHQWEQKPAGRTATSIPICWTHRQGVLSDGHIDLSVMPQKSVSTQDDLTAFEAWVKADSTLPLDRDAFGYADMTTALMWHAWQAANKQTKPQPVQQEPCPECDGTGTVAGSQAHFPCPLYTSPQAAQPLSDDRIAEFPVWRHFVGLTPEHRIEITREIEQAHGIKE